MSFGNISRGSSFFTSRVEFDAVDSAVVRVFTRAADARVQSGEVGLSTCMPPLARRRWFVQWAFRSTSGEHCSIERKSALPIQEIPTTHHEQALYILQIQMIVLPLHTVRSTARLKCRSRSTLLVCLRKVNYSHMALHLGSNVLGETNPRLLATETPRDVTYPAGVYTTYLGAPLGSMFMTDAVGLGVA